MNQDQNGLNQNNFNVQGNDKAFNKQSFFSNKNLTKIEIIISIINFLFCLISCCIVTGSYFSQIFNSDGSSSGWFLFIIPIIVGVYILAFIPDTLCLLFSFLYNSKKKKVFPILIIIFSIVGCIIMNSALITELLIGMNILQLIYTVFKIIIIFYNIIILILFKK